MAAASTLRSIDELAAAGLVAAGQAAHLEPVARRYAVALTPDLARLIDRTDPADPIARQFVPSAAELETRADELVDPIGERAHSPVEGIVHRYPDRALLLATHACAVYCRFCFRREVVGPAGAGTLSPEALRRAIGYIAEHPAIWEVILTGGDPLILSPRRLREILAGLAPIAHLKIVRLHTRVPIADPGRITPALIAALKSGRQSVYVALHANHPRELTPAARAACARLVDAGIPMLSQTVLLAGVNDDPATLEALMRAFVEARVKPYYLHQMDPAPGAARFRTTLATGRALMRKLRERASGLCQPVYMLDDASGPGKTPVGPADIAAPAAGYRATPAPLKPVAAR